MHLGGHFPEILDIIEIPLSDTGPDFEFESENRTILKGEWNLAGKATPQDVMKYAQRPRVILHNHKKFCTLEEMQAKPFQERITLQLIHVRDFRVRDTRANETDKPSWKGLLRSAGREIEVGITDPVFFNKLNEGHEPSRNCLLTMSMTLPKAFDGWEGSPPCWKLIAGVIELD
ncbi:dual OB domain-containing protein [Kiritimatiella glycovorans]|uniref:Dual OB-containing domain-containing protein n=1 Tax=Kiritimatiella glycovorans TaxID=1307763 RepID=A0A0G3EJ55_9BACT|nr:hypothetical protein [Kiritimatiella glycovorans]AKJ64219.1 hypothetical protein L21SP4_00958 [Kiritimatiella glycovorans]